MFCNWNPDFWHDAGMALFSTPRIAENIMIELRDFTFRPINLYSLGPAKVKPLLEPSPARFGGSSNPPPRQAQIRSANPDRVIQLILAGRQ